jgi:hypothetical protein
MRDDNNLNKINAKSNMAHRVKHNFEELIGLISCFRTFVLS